MAGSCGTHSSPGWFLHPLLGTRLVDLRPRPHRGCPHMARMRRLGSRRITVAAFVTAAAFAVFQVQVPLFGGRAHEPHPPHRHPRGPCPRQPHCFYREHPLGGNGHGGWGLIGANVLVNFSEVMTGWLAFRGLKRVTGSLFSRAGIATFAGLFVGNIVMVVIILISGIQGVIPDALPDSGRASPSSWP